MGSRVGSRVGRRVGRGPRIEGQRDGAEGAGRGEGGEGAEMGLIPSRPSIAARPESNHEKGRGRGRGEGRGAGRVRRARFAALLPWGAVGEGRGEMEGGDGRRNDAAPLPFIGRGARPSH